MRKLLWLLLIGLAFGQTTPNLGLNVPTPGTQTNQWGTLLNENFYTIDGLLGGTTPLPYFNAPTAGNINGVLNPVACSGLIIPSWCSGSSILPWIQAAINAVGCGEVYIPKGIYTDTSCTSVLVPRCVQIQGASGTGTQIYSPNVCAGGNWPFIVADPNPSTVFPEGQIANMEISGPGASTASGGIYIGGSDGQTGSPGTGIDPNTNYGNHFNLNNLFVIDWGTGLQFGNNAYNDTLNSVFFTNNGTGLSFPANGSITNSGETIAANNSSFNNGVTGINLGASNAINFNCSACSADANTGWGVTTAAGLFTWSGGSEYSAQKWLQANGPTVINGVYFSGGASSGTLGYLFDNESNYFNVFGGQWDNGGSATQYFNPSGHATAAVYGTLLNCCGAPPAMTALYIDNSGNIWLNGVLSSFSALVPHATTFSALSTCSSSNKYRMQMVSDSSTATYNATITGGGSNVVMALCNGTNWTAH